MPLDNNDESSFSEKSSDVEDSSSTSHNHTSSATASSDSDNKKEAFVRKESRQILYLRLAVLAVLLLVAAAVSVLIHSITVKGEDGSFEDNYDAAAGLVTEAFVSIAREKMGAAGSFVVAIVASGMAKRNPWPFNTVSSFQERASTILELSGAIYLGVNPLVEDAKRKEWENYTNYDGNASSWYREARDYQKRLGIDDFDTRPQITTEDPQLNMTTGIANHIYDFGQNYGMDAVISPQKQWYLPVWQGIPVGRQSMVNQNTFSTSKAANECILSGKVAFEGMFYSTPGGIDDANPVTATLSWLLTMANNRSTQFEGDIFTMVYFPIFEDFNKTKTVGAMWIAIHFARYFQNLLFDSARGLIVVLENSCEEPFTYRIDAEVVTPLGHGDLHDPKFDQYVKTASFEVVKTIKDGTSSGLTLAHGNCPYSIRVYPSQDFLDTYQTSTPMIVTVSVLCVFVFTVFMFFIYDRLVERRQSLLLRKATQSHDIVSSLFPKNVRDQLLLDDDNKKARNTMLPSGNRLKSFLDDKIDDSAMNQVPIADLYPHTTVLFADIAGFTAWSSSREPAQVFILLQCVYQAFDTIAKRRKVFKVETIGDSYMAATGLPDPQPNHAIIMVRFASECLLKVAEITRHLETTLGPDTGDLTMRFGIHSGPVTAGVLRGERSRFQLFGDTVNTAARMESTGAPGRIQCSQATAELLVRVGKGHWVKPREDNVHAKGKGVLTTFWLTPVLKKAASTGSGSSETGNSDEAPSHRLDVVGGSRTETLLKHERLIDWMVEILKENVRRVVACHTAAKKMDSTVVPIRQPDGHIPLDELAEAVKLPDFDATIAIADENAVDIPENIVESLRAFVAIIASTYRDNPFHNFEHACHVTLSVSKFLKRIVAPDIDFGKAAGAAADDTSSGTLMTAKSMAFQLHDYTHGLTSDPITIFAIVFSALIHDVDHRGIANAQLIKEEPAMAATFRNQSVAEQNSLDISWELLMADRFTDLRKYIFADQDELARFRQVVVNVVLATDIFDKEMNDLRKLRWDNAFSDASVAKNKNDLRATIVVEHIMQASDVCHTMQHWHIYRKWNKRLFFELLSAHRAGRMAADPAMFWYQGEIGFFDNYIIPLAKKLKECNVFGVSSDECLIYALRNREEWESRGRDIVAEMMEEFAKTGMPNACQALQSFQI